MADEQIMGSIQTISGILTNALNPSTPLREIPKAQILVGTKFRGGLSALDIAGRIIQRKKEAGIPITPLPSGGQNLDIIMETIRVEEIVKALLTEAKIEVASAPGTNLTASGGNVGGPIVVQGMTTSIVKGEGIIR